MSTGDKILVIDDNPETQDSITVGLELAGYTVVVAKDGIKGLSVL
jgi:DNA-binding response OmpR family regulator